MLLPLQPNMNNQSPTTPVPPPVTATIALSNIQFQPWSPGNFSTAQFSLVGQTPGVTLDGETIIVAVPPEQVVNLVFQIMDPNYVLLGIAFNPDEPCAPLGRQEFPLVTIQRTAPNSQLTVTDKSLALFFNVAFNYVLFVQQVGTGAIGVIDPAIENEPEN